jgi:CRP-like cAMP-binding protein
MLIERYINKDEELGKLFHSLTSSDLARFELKYCKANDFLINKDSSANSIYFIFEGVCGIMQELLNGETYCSYKINSLAIIGLSEILPKQSSIRKADVIAVSDITVFSIDKFTFKKFQIKYPDFYNRCIQVIIERLHQNLMVHIECKKYDAKMNIVSYLIHSYKLYCKLPKVNKNGVFINETRQMIADFTGISQRSVNATIEMLKNIDLVTVDHQKLYINIKQYKALLEYKFENT